MSDIGINSNLHPLPIDETLYSSEQSVSSPRAEGRDPVTNAMTQQLSNPVVPQDLQQNILHTALTDQIVSAATEEVNVETFFIFPNFFGRFSDQDEQGNTVLHQVSSLQECEDFMEEMEDWLTAQDILTLLTIANNYGETPIDVAIAAGLDTANDPTFSRLFAVCHLALHNQLAGVQLTSNELRALGA